jgi:hypothetical protein|tara:strand:+ start:890 stop:1090 length:201 start_codon:yes stop_codon:yes gene_type:complete
MGLGGISIWQLIIILFIFLVPFLIFGPVAKKAGYSRWWALLAGVPLLNLIVLWIFAFAKWPADTGD